MRLSVVPMRALLDPDSVAELRERLMHSRWSGPTTTDGWAAGVSQTWLQELATDWRRFDVGGFQDRLDALEHVCVDVDGQLVHAVHALGRGPDPMPLLLTHGWPGSFCEYLDLIPLLTDPQAHGGDAGDAFSVVAPSLPGFGFSAAPPPGGLTAGQVATLWHRLMAEGMG